jgi:hypothetical protein
MKTREKKKKLKIAADWKARMHRIWNRGVRKDVKVGSIVESCDLHIGHVLNVDRNSGDMSVQSILTGKIGNCDLYHCGIVVQNDKEIRLKLALYNTGGKEALRDYYHKECMK